MERYNEVLVRLARIALGTACGPKTAAEASLERKLSAQEWQAVYGAASKHAILGVLLPAIERLPEEERPPMGVSYQWLKDQTTIRLNNEKIHECASQVRKLFADAGFRTHVLKGLTLARIYPDPSLRQIGDIDLWVDGERSAILSFAMAHAELGERLYHHCDAQFFEDVNVEIHHRPSWFYNPIFNRRFMAFVDQHRERVFAGGDAPDIVFELVYNMVHIFRHIFHEGVGLRHMIDYFHLLKASSRDERAEAYEVLCRLGLRDFCAAMMYVETEVLGLQEIYSITAGSAPGQDQSSSGKHYGKKLFEEIMETGNFGMLDRRNEGRIRKIFRFFMISPHETVCAIPWKCWHLCWRAVHNKYIV